MRQNKSMSNEKARRVTQHTQQIAVSPAGTVGLALVSLPHEHQPCVEALRPQPGSHSALSQGFPPAVGNSA
jgi:hypothetical protein